MPFSCFKKLYESLVLPVVHYGSAVWGHQQYSSINSVHNKACRYFLGVNKYTANAAVQGEMGLDPPIVNQHLSIVRQWCRLVNMDGSRLNKKIFIWATQYAKVDCKNWVYRTFQFYKSNGLNDLCDVNNNLVKSTAVDLLPDVSRSKFVNEWKKEICREQGKRSGGNKLRTYCEMKFEFETEFYVKNLFNKRRRSALAKFRCGCAPIRLETGRYEGLNVEDRKCLFCDDCIEDEVHVITQCCMYDDLREHLYACVTKVVPDFESLCDIDKTFVILANQDFNIVHAAAKICSQILERRKFFI